MSSSQRHSQTKIDIAHQNLVSNSGLPASRDTTTSACQPMVYLVPDDRAERPLTPRTESFPSAPMPPTTVSDGRGRDDDVIELRGSSAHSFHATDRHPPGVVARPRSAPEAAHGPTLFLVPEGRTTITPVGSYLSGCTPITSPQENEHCVSQEEQILCKSLCEAGNYHGFNRAIKFNRVNADTLMPWEPYAREIIPWPTELDSVKFLDILEGALQPHAWGCNGLYSPPTDCQTCIARINAKGIMTKFLIATLCPGESVFAICDQWCPNDDWLTVGVKPRDQHFVRLGMLLVRECILSIIEQMGIPDPKVSRMSTANSGHSRGTTRTA